MLMQLPGGDTNECPPGTLDGIDNNRACTNRRAFGNLDAIDNRSARSYESQVSNGKSVPATVEDGAKWQWSPTRTSCSIREAVFTRLLSPKIAPGPI